MSQSSAGSQSTAPTYMVEENRQGELVRQKGRSLENHYLSGEQTSGCSVAEESSQGGKELSSGRSLIICFSQKRYPDYSSGQSLATSDGEDQFKTSVRDQRLIITFTPITK